MKYHDRKHHKGESLILRKAHSSRKWEGRIGSGLGRLPTPSTNPQTSHQYCTNSNNFLPSKGSINSPNIAFSCGQNIQIQLDFFFSFKPLYCLLKEIAHGQSESSGSNTNELFYIYKKPYVLMHSFEKKKTLSMGKPDHETSSMLVIELYLISPDS